jgi:hypothetical protein
MRLSLELVTQEVGACELHQDGMPGYVFLCPQRVTGKYKVTGVPSLAAPMEDFLKFKIPVCFDSNNKNNYQRTLKILHHLEFHK